MTDSTTPNPATEPATEPASEPMEPAAPEVVELAAPEEVPVMAAAEPEPVAEPAPVVEAEPPAPVAIPVAEPAPLAAPAAAPPSPEPAKADAPAAAASSEVLGLPLKLLNELLAKIGSTQLHSLADLVPALRILALAVVAGIALKLTSATLGAIDDLPLVGGLLELVGLVSLLNFLARNAFKQQKRAELLGRIQKLKTDLLG
ncbi:hypothetical protein NZK27_05690 [Synechococcus sp. FGCU-3]|nr:hypothetical protein [Synechococcus sp. FGCU3]